MPRGCSVVSMRTAEQHATSKAKLAVVRIRGHLDVTPSVYTSAFPGETYVVHDVLGKRKVREGPEGQSPVRVEHDGEYRYEHRCAHERACAGACAALPAARLRWRLRPLPVVCGAGLLALRKPGQSL